MNRYRAVGAALFLGAVIASSASLAGCETEDPTWVVVENAYPDVPTGGAPSTRIVVYRVWWEVVLFEAPVLPGASSAEQRGVPQSDTAYALLAPGWDPESGTPPTTLVALKSKAPLHVARGDTLRIRVSDATFVGSCAANQPLTAEDAALIAERIFPVELASVRYDAATCTSSPLHDDGDAGDAADTGNIVDASQR